MVILSTDSFGFSRRKMKRLLITTIAAVVLVGCASYREAYFNDMWNNSGGRETNEYEYQPGEFRWAAPDDDWDGSWPEERD